MATAAPTYAAFIALYPQFESLDEITMVQPQLDFSALLLDPSAWGSFYSYAVSLDAAHNFTLNQLVATGGVNGALQGAAGPMTNVSAAGMSASFQSVEVNGKAQSAVWYSKTLFGQAFLRLKNAVISPAFMATDVHGPVMPSLPYWFLAILGG